MNAQEQWKQNTADPLGLRELESIEPGYDGWDSIASALQTHHDNKLNRQLAGRWLAVAASLVLVISLSLRNSDNGLPAGSMNPDVATSGANLASVSRQDNIKALIGLSQNIQDQVKQLRQQTGSMPAESAIYVAELEDLIAQVDNELSLTPDSIDLWGQRVNLLLDLAQIYQQPWQIDYGRMAAL